MWLLGEGLNAVMASQARGWSPTDEQGFVSACHQWVQQSASGSCLKGLGQPPRKAVAAGPEAQKDSTPRPTLDLRQSNLSDLPCPAQMDFSIVVVGELYNLGCGRDFQVGFDLQPATLGKEALGFLDRQGGI